MMEAKFFLFLFLVVLLGRGTEGLRHRHRRHHLPKRLFVFGDSYADTGTIWRGLADCWKPPYGSTFPGKPAGRFSDGRVIIDFVVVDQIEADLQHLVKLGVGRIGMLGLGPTGCVPMMTQNTSYSSCVDIFNHDAAYHNALLHEAVDAINTHASLRSTVAVFDMFDTLNSLVLGADKLRHGIKNPLRPCCVGTAASSSCGDTDQKGKPLNKVCDDPGKAVFWDSSHPTQATWSTIFQSLLPTQHLFS